MRAVSSNCHGQWFLFWYCKFHLWKECEFDRSSDYTQQKEYPSHSAAAAAVVYKWYTSLFTYARFELFRSWKKSLTSVRARNSMLSRPFAADECFSSISYFIFLYSQFTVKKLNVGHEKNTEWKCCDFAKWRGDHLWRYRNKS